MNSTSWPVCEKLTQELAPGLFLHMLLVFARVNKVGLNRGWFVPCKQGLGLVMFCQEHSYIFSPKCLGFF